MGLTWEVHIWGGAFLELNLFWGGASLVVVLINGLLQAKSFYFDILISEL